ncbi:hypothetical protein C6A87_012480 [Mycobacterium sp. ITM-2016-00317]|uniref:hypothetical protein n=1 Tax=Mycobacterium sp. ITM-2016-00317 TaxID=2099694 RepID=UPI00287F850C|nr:hypothetical protein [Mycobacterium sp. ITM-2016-00317]WNG89880.1 hypothetical protein C6A87_012480 [Mycobacterium sp. ITM-2016-00317]
MGRIGRRERTGSVRVAALDVQHSHRRSAVVLGPVALPPLDELTARLLAMAEAGPAARIALQPSTSDTGWRFSPSALRRAVSSTDHVPADPVELLTTLRQCPGGGLRILAAGDHLAIDFSHGLGEVPLLDMLVGVLLGAVDPRDDAVWAPYRRAAPPLVLAGVRAIGLSPQRLLPLWRQHRRNAGAPEPAVGGGTRTLVPSPATRVAQVPAEMLADLRRLRDSALPGVNMFAVQTCALHEAFAAAGLDVDPAVTVPFDVRRYLPDGHSTLASFSAGLDFTLDRDDGPQRLQAEMTAAARMARPVANLLAGTVKTRAAMRSGHHAEPLLPDRPRLRLLHSSIGTVPRNPWVFSDPGQARLLVASDPAARAG